MQARTTSRLLLGNTAWTVSSSGFAGVVGWMIVPMIYRHMGREQYGIWVLIGSVFAYATTLQLGLSSAVNRYVPVSLACGRTEELRKIAGTSMVFFMAVAAVVGGLTIVVYWNLPKWFSVPPHLVVEARAAVAATGCLTAMTVCLQVYGAVLSGYQDYKHLALGRIFVTGVRVLALLAAIRLWGTIVSVALVYGVSELVLNGYYAMRVSKLIPGRRLRINEADGRLLLSMLSYGVNTLVYTIGALIILKSSEMLIGAYLGAGQVALYSLAATAVMPMSMIVESFCAAMKPAASDLDARGDASRLIELALLGKKYTLCMILPGTAILLFLGKPFMRLWTHDDAPEMLALVPILAIASAIRLSQYSTFIVLVGKGEHKVFGWLVLFMGLISSGLSALTLGWLDGGIVGVGLSNLAGYCFVSGIVLPIYAQKKLGVPWGLSYTRVWMPSVKVTVPCAAFLLLGLRVYPPMTWLSFSIVAGGGALCALLAMWFWCLEPAERQRLVEMRSALTDVR